MLAAMASRAAKAGYPYATLFAVKSGYSIGEWPASIHPATPPTSAHACAHCRVWSCAVRVRVHCAATLAVHPIKVIEQDDRYFERGLLIVKVHVML